MPHMNGASRRLNYLYNGESSPDGCSGDSDFSHYNGIEKHKDKPKKKMVKKIMKISKSKS